jgi:hypothetical protein
MINRVKRLGDGLIGFVYRDIVLQSYLQIIDSHSEDALLSRVEY